MQGTESLFATTACISKGAVMPPAKHTKEEMIFNVKNITHTEYYNSMRAGNKENSLKNLPRGTIVRRKTESEQGDRRRCCEAGWKALAQCRSCIYSSY